MADNYPTEIDLRRFLYAANLIDSATEPTGRYALLDYGGAVNGARAEFERRTGRVFVSSVEVTEAFDPVTVRNGRLDLGREWYSISSVEVDGTAQTVTDDFLLEPYGGPPYSSIRFLVSWTAPVPWGSLATVEVTGVRGWGSVPDDVWQAILRRAAGTLLPSVVGIQTSGMAAAGVASLRLGDADVAFKPPTAGSSSGSLMGSGWDAVFESAVSAYRAVRVF